MSYLGTTVDWTLHLGAGPELLTRAEELRKTMTPAEKLLWKALRNRRVAGLKFRRQHALHLYIVDFYCHELRLAVEVDGGIHEHEDIKDHDLNRDAELERLGVRVLRFTNEDVMLKTSKVLNEISTEAKLIELNQLNQLNSPHPPTPSPSGEGEKNAHLPLSSGLPAGRQGERCPKGGVRGKKEKIETTNEKKR